MKTGIVAGGTLTACAGVALLVLGAGAGAKWLSAIGAAMLLAGIVAAIAGRLGEKS